MTNCHMRTCDTASKSLRCIFFDQKNLVNGGSTPVDLLAVFVSIGPYFKVYFCTKAQIQHLGNTCWPSVDQHFFIWKYVISAFKCRINRPHSAFLNEYLIWWLSAIFTYFLRWSKTLTIFWKVKNDQIRNFRQHLWTTCVRYEYNHYLTSKGSISSLLTSNIMAWNRVAISGGRKNLKNVPKPRCWNNYLQFFTCTCRITLIFLLTDSP